MNISKNAIYGVTLLLLTCSLPALALGSESIGDNTVEAEEIEPIYQPNNNIQYVPMPNPAKPRQVSLSLEGAEGVRDTLRSIGRNMVEFVERVSRGKVNMTTEVGPIRDKNEKGRDTMRLVLKPGAHSRVPIIGNAITAKHELMHQFELGHANTRIWKSQLVVERFRSSRDPFDVLTVTPGKPSLNAPHIHFLGWFSDTEEAYAEVGDEYILRLLNDGSKDFSSLKALYYQVPGTDRELWFSYVKVDSKGWKAPEGMPGTAIAVHSTTPTGGSYFEGLIGLNKKTNIRSGLILELSEVTAKTVKVKVSKDPNWVLELPKTN